jgi:hypothetical protein
VIYSGGCVDITSDVLAKIDAEESKEQADTAAEENTN